MKKSKKITLCYIGVVISMILCGAVNVLLAFCLKEAVDAAIAQDMQGLGIALLFTLAAAVLEFVIGYISQKMLRSYCRLRLINAKENRYLQLLLNKEENGMELSAFSTDVDMLSKNYANKCRMVYCIAQLVCAVASIVYLSWKVALVALITTFIPMIVPAIMQSRMQKTTKNYSEQSRKYLDFVQDTFSGIYEIRTYRAQEFFRRIHNKNNAEMEQARTRRLMAVYLNDALSNLMGILSFVATIAICGYLTVTGEVTMGTLIAVIQLLNSVVGPIGSISSAAGEISSTKKLAEVYEKRPENKEQAAVNKIGSICARNLSYSYDGETSVLKNFNHTFEQNKRYVILGESGVGKSTLAKLLSGGLSGYSGSIKLCDTAGKELDFNQAQAGIQYVAQEPYVFQLTVVDNVYFGRAEEEQKKKERMKQLGISALFEKGADILANREGISGGQKQRLVIARALAHEPNVLILDEPTANLDSAMARQVMDYVTTQAKGILIVISHNTDKEFLEYFDEVIKM